MEKLYTTVLNWYLGLKPWWKILGFAVLIFLVLLFIVKIFFTRPAPSGASTSSKEPPVSPPPVPTADAVIAKGTDAAVAAADEADAEYEAKLQELRTSLLVRQQEAKMNNMEHAVAADALNSAKSMDDLQRLERKLGLVRP
jgi:hypothetical protein